MDSSSASASASGCGGDEKNKTTTSSSSFCQTFNLLSRYLKDNPFPDLPLTGGIATNKSDHLTIQQSSPRMTIFYAGRIIVFDDLPLDKAKQIINLANNYPHLDLPIARKASLARFLHKRKERITARAPYHHTSPSNHDNKPSIGLPAQSPLAQFQNQS